ncbi:MAG: helix-turn-helix transcriptional regulator [Gemmatimonadaceae bacterium]|nr:helix-turn-helix transcriptional regulator [Gemmatimonadaceae bacterium]
MLALASILSEFGLPYIRCSTRGEIVEISPAARRQLGDDDTHVLRELTDLARDTAAGPRNWRVPPQRSTRPAEARIGMRHCGALRVRAVQLSTADGETEVLMILSPEPPDHVRNLFESRQLTEREREIASLLSTGRAIPEVAANLSISVHTAKRHTEKVYAKLGVHNRAELARWMGQLSQV